MNNGVVCKTISEEPEDLEAPLPPPSKTLTNHPCPSSKPWLRQEDIYTDMDRSWKSRFPSEEQWSYFVGLPLNEKQREALYDRMKTPEEPVQETDARMTE